MPVIIWQHFQMISAGIHRCLNDGEMERRHLRAEDRIILTHFFGKGNFLNGGRSDFSWLFLRFFGADGSKQGTNTDTGCSQVIYLINFQTGINLSAAFQNLVNLIRCYGVQSTAEGIQLD